jgi:DNA invertase Pin-like site-specific DNA recombinase
MTQGRRAARYVRVSRSDQSPDLQMDETEGFISRRGWDLVATYTDQGVSGAKDQRKALTEMLADARRRKFDTLVVWRTDRLFRSLRHMVVTLDELSSWGIDFVSVTEPFDTTSPQGRLLFQVAAAFAEFERSLIVERSKAGVEAARRRGKHIGRPHVFVPVVRARQLLASGKSMRQTAASLGVGFATLHRALAKTDPEVGPAGAPATP